MSERSHHIGRADTNPERKRDVKQTQSSSSIQLGWIYRDARQTSLLSSLVGTEPTPTSPHPPPPHHQHHAFLSPAPLLLHLRRTLAPLMDDHKPNHSADVKPPLLDRHNRHSGGGREDCWSEGATATLIDAWGDRHLQLSRGNLRQKDWKDVADAVNARQDALDKPRKTDVQCKNRIDTIKKKYKLERSRPGPSKWPFYAHLEELIGPSGAAVANTNLTLNPKPSHSPSPAVTFTVKKLNPIPNPNSTPNGVIGLYSGGSSSKSRLNSAGSTGSSHGSGDCDPGRNRGVDGGKRKNAAVKEAPDRIAFRELAKAILKFGEVYERIESSKQQQIMELERQRMEFTKDLEFQRMKMFMEAQLQLEKTKRPKYVSGAGKKL